MVWGCMSTACTGELQFIEGNLDSNVCCDALSSETVFQHNNHPKHTAKMTTALLLKVMVMEWPSMSPDLNLLSTCGDSLSGRCRSTMCLGSISSVISLWRSGRGCQQQPLQLWWIPRPGGLRHKYCPYKILTLWTQVWHVHLGCTHFVASYLDINDYMLSYI